jgi:hypothetical protein
MATAKSKAHEMKVNSRPFEVLEMGHRSRKSMGPNGLENDDKRVALYETPIERRNLS